MNIENILKYQKLDGELFKVEQKLSNSAYRKKANEITAIAKKSQAKSTSLEEEADKLIAEIADIKEKYKLNNAKKEEVLAANIDSLSAEELEKYLSLKTKIISNLNILEKMLTKNAERINQILSDFNKTKKLYDEAKAQYAVCKQKIDEETTALEPEKAKLAKELAALEKTVEAEILAEYKKKRNDNIFPVLVELENNAFCSRCRMEQPKVMISRIKEKGVIVCEHCKRFIYQK